MATARQAALMVLYSIEFEGAYSNLALLDGLKNSGLSPEDRGFATSLVYGVVSMKRTLDAVISKYSSVKPKKLSKYVLLILRMGLYQLMFMDRVPPSAAVNESVKLASRYAGKSRGFVNGVLRSAVRGGFELENVCDRLSYPDWLYEKWTAELGERAEDLMVALNQPPDMTIRANSLKIKNEELIEKLKNEGAEAREGENGAILVSGLNVSASKLFNDGFFTVQDSAAQMAAKVLSPKSGERVLDICAAPGGKTTHIAELMGNSGEVLAFDIHEHKIKLIYDAAERLGISIIKARCQDAAEYDEALFESFDRVLADVPCSGLGIIRRKPDIKWNAAPDGGLYEIQERILGCASKYVKQGGVLVYSTCTLNRLENEHRIEEFLKANREFSLEEMKTFYPDTDKTDGFFIAKLQKNR